MKPIETILDKLQGVQQHGDYFTALCPGHDDNRQSLSISEGDDGRALVKCHAGCETSKILETMGLKMSDLFPKGDGRGEIEATYDYHDASGKLVYQVVRFKPKSFVCRRPNGAGGWLWNLDGTERVLYHLPDLLKEPGRVVFIAEGEKSVDVVRGLGLLATTNPHGAGKWNGAYSEPLRGRPVVILPDNDGAGRDHAQDVAKDLLAKASLVRVLELPNLADKEDVADWIGRGGDRAELEALANVAPMAADWLKTYHPHKEHAQALGARIPADRARAIESIAPESPDPELRRKIHDTLVGAGYDKDNKPSVKYRRAVAGQLMLDWLAEHGGFVQSETGGDLYYFSQQAGTVYDLETDHWRAWLYALTGANPASVDFAYLSADVKTAAILNAPKRPVVRVSAWDDDAQVLRVSRFDGTVYALDGESISEEPNGQNVIFEDNPLWLPYKTEYSSRTALKWSTDLPNWATTTDDKATAYGLAFRAWVVGTFFCELCPTRPLLAFIGEKGSGKSMALRVLLRFLFGPVGQVTGVPDRADGFTAAAAAAHVLVLDNLDNFTGWLRDKLAMVSTGGKDEYRRLYTSKEVGQVVYRCWLGFTSRTPDTLRRDDLADRLLLLPVARIDTPSPERVFLDQATTERNVWWGDLLTTLNEVVARIRKGELASTSTLRMADWESLGRLLAQGEGLETTWDKFIKDLERAQNEFLLEDELIVDALGLWLESEGNHGWLDESKVSHGRKVLTRDLYDEWTYLLFGDKKPPQDWPKSTKSLGRKLASIRRNLRAYYRVAWWQDDRRRTYYQFAPKEN